MAAKTSSFHDELLGTIGFIDFNGNISFKCSVTGDIAVVVPEALVNPKFRALLKKAPVLYQLLTSLTTELEKSCVDADLIDDKERVDGLLDLLHDIYFVKNEILGQSVKSES